MDRESPDVLVAVNHHDTKGGPWIQYNILLLEIMRQRKSAYNLALGQRLYPKAGHQRLF